MTFCIIDRSEWIKTSYIRVIDVWVILCFVSVFYALIEYCLVNFAIKDDPWTKRSNSKTIETSVRVKNSNQLSNTSYKMCNLSDAIRCNVELIKKMTWIITLSFRMRSNWMEEQNL